MTWTLEQWDNEYNGFLDKCEEDLRDALIARTFLLREQGNEARAPISKALVGEDGLFELRAKDKRVQARIIFCFMPGKRIVFLEGCYKEDKIPESSKVRARKRRKELLKGVPNVVVPIRG